jgi:hypothetical protein
MTIHTSSTDFSCSHWNISVAEQRSDGESQIIQDGEKRGTSTSLRSVQHLYTAVRPLHNSSGFNYVST